MDDVTDGACDGIGCCQTTIPEMLLNYNASGGSLWREEQDGGPLSARLDRLERDLLTAQQRTGELKLVRHWRVPILPACPATYAIALLENNPCEEFAITLMGVMHAHAQRVLMVMARWVKMHKYALLILGHHIWW
ncbi:hypothetical protein NL676_036594 [Syzygium grande]|nr:hypothetical protein NL676_036594 [Syzygium grande]